MFAITGGKGFQMKFENGWTVSVQFGAFNYCQRKSYASDAFEQERQFHEEYACPDAEIAAWDKDNKWYDFPCDQVKGHCSSDEVADFISMVKNF